MIRWIIKGLLYFSHWYCPTFDTFFPNRAPCELIDDEECPIDCPKKSSNRFMDYDNVRR